MTLEEISGALKIDSTTIKNQFQRTSARLYKKGILLTKEGRGASAIYNYEYIGDDNRAITLFDETKEEIVTFSDKIINREQLQFYSFLGICATPNSMFHGTYKDFLSYLGYEQNVENVRKLSKALELMEQDKIIMFAVDKTAEDYFFAGITHKAEEEAKVGIQMMRTCKKIIDKYNANGKRYNFISLAKIYIGAEVVHRHEPYTLQQLSDITGLSVPTVRKYEELLVQENVMITNKIYYKDYIKRRNYCAGKEITFNSDEMIEIS